LYILPVACGDSRTPEPRVKNVQENDKVIKIIAIILVIIFMGISFSNLADDRSDRDATIIEYFPDFDDNSTLYVWLDNFRVREKPDLSSMVIDRLQFADEVLFLNEISYAKSTVTIRGKIYTAPWIKIQIKDKTVGWAYSVGFKTEFIKIYTEPGLPEEQINVAHIYENLSTFVPNDDGDRLVATDSVDDPKAITKAIFSDYYQDVVVDVRYIGNKQRTGEEYLLFEISEGPLYETLGEEKVTFEGFVVDESFLKSRKIIPRTYVGDVKESKFHNDLIIRIERLRKWDIEALWLQYADDNSNVLAIALFKKNKGYVMLSILFATPEEVIFHDHIREFREGDDLFRVDDMGEFDPINIGFDFLLKTENEYELIYHWDGAEGRNIYIVRQYRDRFILGKLIYQPVYY
jgi:hypothetical protein